MGIQKLKSDNIQRFKCSSCGHRYTANIGFKNKHYTHDQITTAVNMYFNWESYRKTASTLGQLCVGVSHSTIENWVCKYTGLMDGYLNRIRPHVWERWRTDEVYLKIKGDRQYLYALLDSQTRFWLARMVAAHKGEDDVKPMFESGMNLAGKGPGTLISNGRITSTPPGKRRWTTPRTSPKRPTVRNTSTPPGT